MCGRFTLTVDPADLREAFVGFTFPAQFAPRFNIAPSQPILAIPNDGRNTADFFLWGLIPSWAKDPSMGQRLINARGETLAEKPSFRGSFKYKRCLILADGFYEWKSQPGTKTKVPHFIHLKNRQPFAFAGSVGRMAFARRRLPAHGYHHHRRSQRTDGTDPQPHACDPPSDRLQPHGWTRHRAHPTSLLPLLKPFPADEMDAHPVSTLVNSPANDRPELVVPARDSDTIRSH